MEMRKKDDMDDYTFDLHLTPWAIKFLRWIKDGCQPDETGQQEIIESHQFCRTSRALLRNYYVSFNSQEVPSWKLLRAGELALELVENMINSSLDSKPQ